MAFDLNSVIKTLLEARRAYYETGYATLSDLEYDALEEAVKRYDPNHPIFEKVGVTPSTAWKKAIHSISMGSLQKCHSSEDFIKWAEKFKNELLVMQSKLDGLSLSLDYENSKFIRGVTRGDGKQGEDISANVCLMGGFKENLMIKGFSGSIRAEIVLSRESFNKINSILSEEDKYANPRNAASGISRRLDGKYCKYLQLMYYDISDPINEDEKINKLRSMGLIVPDQIIGHIEGMLEGFNTFKEKRPDLSFSIDGVVIKVNSFNIQQQEGIVQNRPKAQMAWKFDPPGAVTMLNRVTWEVGRTGVITPLGHVEPVEIDGSKISRVTLHNVAEIKRLDIGLGDTIMLDKAGDIIPKIRYVIEHKNVPIDIPACCPVCEKPLNNNNIQLFCMNNACGAKNLQRILHFIKVAKIDEFGESLVTKLFDEGIINNISDIFILEKEDIINIEGWGNKSADTIISNINACRKMKPAIFLAAMGIPSLSTSTAEDLWGKYGSIDKIKKATIEDICTIKGYSIVSATKIIEGLTAFWDQIIQTLKYVELMNQKESGKLSELSFCFTGAMTHPRAYYQDIVNKNGGKNFSTVTKDLSYLVCNEDRGSSKSQKATKFGIKIISEKEFLKLAGELN